MEQKTSYTLGIITGLLTVAWQIFGFYLMNVADSFGTGFVVLFFGVILTSILVTADNYDGAGAAIGISAAGGLIYIFTLSSAQIGWFVVYYGISILIPLIIFLCKTAYKAGKEFVKCVINSFIDIFVLEKEVKNRCPQALKMKIMEKKKNAVDAGIFNSNSSSTPSQIIEFESTQGIDSNIKVGQVYTLT